MDLIKINGLEYDPYFILGVTPEDPIEQITKEFRRKAKVLHPDKLKPVEKTDSKLVQKRTAQFKILVECYNHIFNSKQSFNQRSKEHITTRTYDNLIGKRFENQSDLHEFNQSFERINLDNPNDFGYKTTRIGSLENGNFNELQKEYHLSEIKPKKVFNDKFNPQKFNRVFEYQKSKSNSDNCAGALVIHTTTDGFNGYNSGTLDNCASVSSFNGILIVGDQFGQKGIGYNENLNYSDYRGTFSGVKNPESSRVPEDFKAPQKDTKLTKAEIQRQLSERDKIKLTGNGSKNDFLEDERSLLRKQQAEIERKSNEDRDFILEYQHLFDKQTIQDALNNRLIR